MSDSGEIPNPFYDFTDGRPEYKQFTEEEMNPIGKPLLEQLENPMEILEWENGDSTVNTDDPEDSVPWYCLKQMTEKVDLILKELKELHYLYDNFNMEEAVVLEAIDGLQTAREAWVTVHNAQLIRAKRVRIDGINKRCKKT